jgi:hypothetical protein
MNLNLLKRARPPEFYFITTHDDSSCWPQFILQRDCLSPEEERKMRRLRHDSQTSFIWVTSLGANGDASRDLGFTSDFLIS